MAGFEEEIEAFQRTLSGSSYVVAAVQYHDGCATFDNGTELRIRSEDVALQKSNPDTGEIWLVVRKREPDKKLDAPAISVCMPVYNGANFLPRAFEALVSQTFKDFELIVVDDCSRDGSASVARELMERHGIKGNVVVRSRNIGPEQCRDVAIQHASSDIIAQLDCDDCWSPTYLEEMLAVFRECPQADLVYCDLVEEFPDGKEIRKSDKTTWIDVFAASPASDAFLFERPSFFRMLLSGQVLFPPCTVYRRELYDRAGPYTLRSQELRISLDWDFGLRASRVGNIAFLKRPLLRKYVHGNNISHRAFCSTAACSVQVLRWTLADPTLLPVERKAARARGAFNSASASYHSWAVDHKQWQAFRWALTSLRFRRNKMAAKMLLLSAVPRAAIERLRTVTARSMIAPRRPPKAL